MMWYGSLVSLLLVLPAALEPYAHAQSHVALDGQPGGKTEGRQQNVPMLAQQQEQAMAIHEGLKVEYNTKQFKGVPQMKVREVFRFLGPRLNVQMRFDIVALKGENLEIEDILDSDVTFQDLPNRLELGVILRLALANVPARNCTYVIRWDHLEITTRRRAEALSRPQR
jgi:hypothetical protein